MQISYDLVRLEGPRKPGIYIGTYVRESPRLHANVPGRFRVLQQSEKECKKRNLSKKYEISLKYWKNIENLRPDVT